MPMYTRPVVSFILLREKGSVERNITLKLLKKTTFSIPQLANEDMYLYQIDSSFLNCPN